MYRLYDGDDMDICKEFEEFKHESFIFEGYEAIIYFPKVKNGKWVIKTEYCDAFPLTELDFLKRGYCKAFIQNKNRWGIDEDLDRKARFIDYISSKYGLEKKCALVGMSCGGLIGIKFAAKYPDKVAAIYLDAPVLDYFSCPCGQGKGEPLSNGNGIPEMLEALSLPDLDALKKYKDMPLHHLEELIENRIPYIMVAGDSDKTVPFDENGIYLKDRYEKAGDIPFEVHIKQGCDHHPHGLEDTSIVIDFIDKNY